MPALAKAVCNSKQICSPVLGIGPGSLQAKPALSYETDCINFATSGCTNAQVNEKSPLPFSNITVGDPLPWMFK
jgi:hypothetical protein